MQNESLDQLSIKKKSLLHVPITGHPVKDSVVVANSTYYLLFVAEFAVVVVLRAVARTMRSVVEE